jgi:hypothetical protein
MKGSEPFEHSVNPELRGQPRVLDNAPLMGYDERFETDGFKHFDVVSTE